MNKLNENTWKYKGYKIVRVGSYRTYTVVGWNTRFFSLGRIKALINDLLSFKEGKNEWRKGLYKPELISDLVWNEETGLFYSKSAKEEIIKKEAAIKEMSANRKELIKRVKEKLNFFNKEQGVA